MVCFCAIQRYCTSDLEVGDNTPDRRCVLKAAGACFRTTDEDNGY